MQNTEDYYHITEKELLKELNTSEKGLSIEETKNRLEKYGLNELKKERKFSVLKLLMEEFTSVLVIILIIAAVAAAFLGDELDSILILIIVIVNGLFGFIQNYKAEKSVEALKKMSAPKAMAIRNGKKQIINSSELVPGDIIYISQGDKVPADCRLLSLSDLSVNESILTGESNSVSKKLVVLKENVPVTERLNSVFMNTIVDRGSATAVVVSTGMSTEVGKIAFSLQEIKEEPTPLQRQLDKLGKRLGTLIMAITAIVFFIGLAANIGVVQMFLTAVSLAVAAIPEGLPAVVTLSMALGVRRMASKNAIIRKLPAVEGLGSVNLIFTDKTGTLTENKMTVRRIYFNNEIITVTGTGYEPNGAFISKHRMKKEMLQPLTRIGLLCNNAELTTNKEYEVVGDPTEAALIVSAIKSGLNQKEENEIYKRIEEIPFESERKLMSTMHVYDNDKKQLMLTKGSPSTVLSICNKILVNGKEKELNNYIRQKVMEANEDMAKDALRVLAFAYKDMKLGEKASEKDMIFVGMQGMIDPPRHEVKKSIQECRESGIRVVMLTGDQKHTALAIAKELGMETDDIVTGEELADMTKKEVVQFIKSCAVFARVTPSDKLRIATATKKAGYVIAMTGDGVNDAPALKKADIGVSMGIMGTDVAKESSEMILTDDNFVTIVEAIKEGRTIYDNIKKFVNYLLSSNIGEVLTIFLAFILGGYLWGGTFLPIVAVQLLWLNLLTDGLPALALGVDPSEPEIMKRKPRSPKANILDRKMLINITTTGILIALGALILFDIGLNTGLEKAQTMVFTGLVVFEMVRLQTIRSEYKLGVFSNKWLIIAVTASLLLQLLVVYTPLNSYFHTVALLLEDWLWILGVTVAIFAINYIISKIKD